MVQSSSVAVEFRLRRCGRAACLGPAPGRNCATQCDEHRHPTYAWRHPTELSDSSGARPQGPFIKADSRASGEETAACSSQNGQTPVSSAFRYEKFAISDISSLGFSSSPLSLPVTAPAGQCAPKDGPVVAVPMGGKGQRRRRRVIGTRRRECLDHVIVVDLRIGFIGSSGRDGCERNRGNGVLVAGLRTRVGKGLARIGTNSQS